jgi:serpin B
LQNSGRDGKPRDSRGTRRQDGPVPDRFRPTRRALLAAALTAPALRPAHAETDALPAAGRFGGAMESLGDRLLGLADQPNALVSPWSLHAALSLLAFGARGRTATEFAGLLGAGGLDDLTAQLRGARLALGRASVKGARITRAEAGWVGLPRNFTEGWQVRADRALGTRGRSIDFARPDAARVVNDWASRTTNGAIPVLVEDLPDNADFILVSALHLLGRWTQPFEVARTAPAPFRAASGEETPVPMMRALREARYGRRDQGHAVILPYAGGSAAMLVATAVDPADTPAFLAMLREQGLIAWLRRVPFQPTPRVDLRLPRFAFDSGAELLPKLAGLGFGGVLGADADLSGVTGRRTEIDAILQRVRVAVDERSTEAAAATAVIATRAALRITEFSADRPFAFAIGTLAPRQPFIPLLLGRVGDAARAQG